MIRLLLAVENLHQTHRNNISGCLEYRLDF